MTRRNQYLALTIVCIFLVILIEASFVPLSSSQAGFSPSLDQAKITASPKRIIFGIFVLFYCFIVLIGIGQLVVAALRKLAKKTSAAVILGPKPFPLSEERASKLLSLVFVFLLISYLIPACLYWWGFRFPVSLIISLNMLLQLAVIFLVYSYFKPKNLGSWFGKKDTIFALRMYSAALPVLLAAIILNHFLAEKLGFAQSLNPAIELLYFLKSKAAIFLLVFQVVILGPLAEELFFRGFIYKLFRTGFSFWRSAIIISLLFSLLHRVPYSTLPLFVLSMFFCYVYEKSQSIYPCFLFHSLFNTINLSFFMVLKDFI